MSKLDFYRSHLQAMQEARANGDLDEIEMTMAAFLDIVAVNRLDLLVNDPPSDDSEEDVKADEVEIGSLVKGGWDMFGDSVVFHKVTYKTGMNAFQASKAACHDSHGNFSFAGYTSNDTLSLRTNYAQMTMLDANQEGRKVLIKDLNPWDDKKDAIMKEIVVEALKLDDESQCKVDFTLMPKEDSRIIHIGPNEHFGVNPSARTHDGYCKGGNLIGEIVTEYYNQWKTNKTSTFGSSSKSSSKSSKNKKAKI